MFGQHMFTNGKDYSLARKLNALNEVEIAQLPRSERQQLSREKVKERIHQAYEKAAKRYNVKPREIRYSPGQEIHKRNFVISDFSKNRNSSCHQSAPVPATSAHYPLVPRCDPEVSTSVRHKQ